MQKDGAGRCIFCGSSSLSKEHIYPKWMREHMVPYNMTAHKVSFGPGGRDALHRRERGPLTVKGGDHRGRGLKVVCKACNNGWMSAVQNDAKPDLLPLLEEGPHALGSEQRVRVASWAVMFTMVFDQADQRTRAIPQDNRTVFMHHGRPRGHWMVWVASFSGLRSSGKTFHRGFAFVDREHGEDAVAPECNAQLTSGAVGKLFFLTFYTSKDSVKSGREGKLLFVCARLGLQRVWPPGGDYGPYVGNTIDDDSFDDVMERVTDALR